ncbi:unnamed protein product [Diabrotica balteata]|uniref:Uncharacterized protein n=1 Tax=Diabrotica balteata TaxID=107213 RepID=A0A9N9SRJ9_DIABA|nr:unnamed protein product [Diabrotica balteata]
MESYMPVSFSVKKSKYFTDGTKHVFQEIQSQDFLLLSMLVDEKKHIRKLALRRVITARNLSTRPLPRNFVTPKLIFSATDYTEMIDWGRCQYRRHHYGEDQLIKKCLQ